MALTYKEGTKLSPEILSKIKGDSELTRLDNLLREAAALADTYKSCLSDIETGKMNVKIIQLKKLADLLGVDVKDFL